MLEESSQSVWKVYNSFGSQMQQLYLATVQWKRYGDKVRSRMLHLVNLLPDAVGGVPDHEGGLVQHLMVTWWWPENTREVDHVAPSDWIWSVTADVQNLGICFYFDFYRVETCPAHGPLSMGRRAFPSIPSGRLPVSLQDIVVGSNTCKSITNWDSGHLGRILIPIWHPLSYANNGHLGSAQVRWVGRSHSMIAACYHHSPVSKKGATCECRK